jgi:hypothetical protein
MESSGDRVKSGVSANDRVRVIIQPAKDAKDAPTSRRAIAIDWRVFGAFRGQATRSGHAFDMSVGTLTSDRYLCLMLVVQPPAC